VGGNWEFNPIRVDAGSAATESAAEDLELDDLQGIVDTAIGLLAGAGASADELEGLRGVTFSLADLGEDVLAIATSSVIQIDVDAAGYGWFVDATPEDNDEFIAAGLHELVAIGDGPAADRVDLLTVVLHEMGHVLGREHGDDGTVMDGTLPLGTRRVWEDLDWLF
jgi:hypothetical protein